MNKLDLWFDDFTRSVGKATVTRRVAMKRFGGSLAGAMVVSMIPRVVTAQGQDSGNGNICAAEQQVGDHQGQWPPQCPPPFVNDPQTCLCVCPPTSCGPFERLNPATCQCVPVPAATACTNIPGHQCVTVINPCIGTTGCICYNTVEGTTACAKIWTCDVPVFCNSSADCQTKAAPYGPGSLCAVNTCCGLPTGFSGVCVPACASLPV